MLLVDPLRHLSAVSPLSQEDCVTSPSCHRSIIFFCSIIFLTQCIICLCHSWTRVAVQVGSLLSIGCALSPFSWPCCSFLACEFGLFRVLQPSIWQSRLTFLTRAEDSFWVRLLLPSNFHLLDLIIHWASCSMPDTSIVGLMPWLLSGYSLMAVCLAEF